MLAESNDENRKTKKKSSMFSAIGSMFGAAKFMKKGGQMEAPMMKTSMMSRGARPRGASPRGAKSSNIACDA